MAIPSEKRDDYAQFLDGIAKDVHGRTRTGSIEADSCVTCGGPADEFKDLESRREYTISGMCQECQNQIFGE